MANRVTSVMFLLAMLLAGANATRELQRTYESGGSCEAVAISGSDWKVVEDAWASATKVIFQYVCTVDGSVSGRTFMDKLEEHFHSYAVAAVSVYAKAIAHCKTVGDNTIGCAWAEAYAEKEVSARAKGYALAVAIAVNQCNKCDRVAIASLSTALIVKITAAAKVKAQAGLCIYGTGEGLAKSYKECWAGSIARVCATAMAETISKGNCLRGSAKAAVDARVKIVVKKPICECQFWRKNAQGKMVWYQPADSNRHCRFHDYAVSG